MTISLALIGNLVIALLLILLLWFILKQFPFMAPYGKIVDIVCMILAVIVVIMALTGSAPLRVVGNEVPVRALA